MSCFVGPGFIACQTIEDRWIAAECERDERLALEREAEARQHAEELAAEAERRGCSEDELEALWQGVATYLPDYDDPSDDPRAEQNLVGENGISIFNPHTDES